MWKTSISQYLNKSDKICKKKICRPEKNMQNYFSSIGHLFKPLSTSAKKDGTTQICNQVVLHQLFKNTLHQKLWKCTSVFFPLFCKSNTNIFRWNATWKSTAHNLLFFPLSYLKPAHVMSFKSMLGFSVHNYAGIMKKKISPLQNNNKFLSFQSQLISSLW